MSFENASTQSQEAAEALAALKALSGKATRRTAALARHLSALADTAEDTIDVLAPAVGCTVADVYE
jgi:hypothetical protein